MKRAVALLLATLIASQGCALRAPSAGRLPGAGRLPSVGGRNVPPPTGVMRVAQRGRDQAPQRTSPADGAAWEKYLAGLPVGGKVKVALATGEEFKGVFMGYENGQVTVRPRTRIPEPVRSIPVANLAWLELDQGGSLARTVGIAAAVAGGTVVAVLAILFAAIDD